MDALSHYHLSEEYAASAGRFLEDMGRSDRSDMMLALAEISATAELAQVHATLALAGATAVRPTDPAWEPRWDDLQAWRQVASVVAPIAPETDGEDEPEDDAVRVGDLSPVEDSWALGNWLRALPERTILRDINGDPCQRGTGEEHRHQQPHRLFPALFVLGDPFELTEGSPQMARLARSHAPFTVLYVGEDDGR